MTPDFEYFIRMRMQGDHGHTLPGILYFDLPVGLVLVFSYFLLVRDPLVNNLPAPVRERMSPIKKADWLTFFRRNWWVVVLSILAGAASHVLWDSFTHNSTFITRNLPLLRRHVLFFFEDYPAYHILQHVSTGIGLAIVITSFFCLPRNSFEAKYSRGYWPGIIVTFLVIFAVRIAFIDEEIKIGHVAVMAIASMMYAMLLISAFYLRRYGGSITDAKTVEE